MVVRNVSLGVILFVAFTMDRLVHADERLFHLIPIITKPSPFLAGGPDRLNDNGVGAGGVLAAGAQYHPIRWSLTGGFELLPPPPGVLYSEAYDINDLGHLAVYGQWPNGETHSYLWTPSAGYEDIGDLAGSTTYSICSAINNTDMIVGQSLGVVCGRIQGAPCGAAAVAVRWTPQFGIAFLGGLSSNPSGAATGINDSGQICGNAVASFGPAAFFYDKGIGMIPLGFAPGIGVAELAAGINNLGQVAGDTDTFYMYLWDPKLGFIVAGKLSGPAPFMNCTAVNDAGEVVGHGRKDFNNLLDPLWGVMLDVKYGLRELNWLLDASSSKGGAHVYGAHDINNKSQMLVTAKLGENGLYLMNPFIPGDMNCDGVVDLADLQPFLGQMLKYAGTTPPLFDGEECGWWIGDINQDALLNEDDLAPFLALLP